MRCHFPSSLPTGHRSLYLTLSLSSQSETLKRDRWAGLVMASQRSSASPPPPAAKGSYHTLSTAIPIRTSFIILTLRTVTLVALWLPRVSSKGSLQFDAMAVTSHPFRPGSGALVSQPSSQASATALPDGRLVERLRVKPSAGYLMECLRMKSSTPLEQPHLQGAPLLSF